LGYARLIENQTESNLRKPVWIILSFLITKFDNFSESTEMMNGLQKQ
jgi:hypothetical protein